MLRERKYYLWLLLALACCHYVSAQVPVSGNPQPQTISSDSLVVSDSSQSINRGDSLFRVRNIVIRGNKRTRAEIILREIPLKPGEAFLLQVLVKKFEDGRRQLMNTSLFHTVVVAAKSFDGYDVDVLVEVRERWYIFPVPYFKPVDRNLNQWLVEQKASLTRVNYGAKLLYNNVTGRNDKLRFWAMGGYTKQLSFSYDRMYIDKKMKWGMSLGFAMGKNKEMNYNTINNKQVFLKDENFVRSFLSVSTEATYRRAIKTRHRIGMSFSREEISDTILKLNPGYFTASRQSISFPELYYIMTYYDLDYIPYPTKGYAAEVHLSQKGFNSTMSLSQLSARGMGSWPVSKRTFFTLGLFGTIKLPFKQPYYNQRMLGYGSMFLQGYEYYVVDGVAAGYIKTTFTNKLFNFNVKIPGKKKGLQRIPFTFYGKVFGNAGYVHNPQPGDNFLADKMLYSGGFGIDIFTIYDVTFKFEWSFNQLGQNGLFLHRNSIF
jgi:outer membrane protein assembly factor BamA